MCSAWTCSNALRVEHRLAYEVRGRSFTWSRRTVLRGCHDEADSVCITSPFSCPTERRSVVLRPTCSVWDVGTPRVSPDDKRIAITIQDGSNSDIWIYEPKRDQMTRLTPGGGAFGDPVWTRDGRHIVYRMWGAGDGLGWRRADRAGQAQVLQAGLQVPTAFSRDGRLAYFQPDASNPQIWSVPIEADSSGLKAGKPERLRTTKYIDKDGSFSPDGRWLAYASDESGIFEVYVQALVASGSAGGGRKQISNSGGWSPAWSPNGRELLYRAVDHAWTSRICKRFGDY